MRIPILLAVLLVFPLASALESFSLTASTGAACTNLPNLVALQVSNTGNQESTYLVRLRTEGLASAEVQPSTFSLKPRQSREISVLYLPKEAGPVTLNFEVETGRGTFQRLQQQLNAGFCTNNQLLVKDFNQTTCPCENATYEFVVTNTGQFPETYTFALDKHSTSATLSQNPVTLQPGNSTTLKLTLGLDCAVSGPQVLRFYSNAQRSGVTTMVPLLLNINACYDYSFEVSAPETMCALDAEQAPIRIRNQAAFTNSFTLSLEGPSWGTLSSNHTTLEPGEQDTLFLELAPEQPGAAVFLVTAASTLGDNRKQRSVPIDVQFCYGLDVQLPERAIVCAEIENTVEARVSNLGTVDEEVALSVSGNDFTTAPESVEVKSHEQEIADLTLSPDQAAKAGLTLNASTEQVSAQDNMAIVAVSKEACYRIRISAPSRVRAFGATEVPVALTHLGVKPATYHADLNAPDGVSIEPDSLTLEPGQKSSFKLIIPSSLEPDRYNVSMTFATDDGQSYQKDMRLDVATTPSFWDRMYTFRYGILTGLALLVLLVLLGIWLARHPPKPAFWWGLGVTIVLIGIAIWALNANTSKILGFFQTYIRYILIGVILLILVILVLNKTEK